MGQPGVGAAAGERYTWLPPALMLPSGSLHLACRMEALEKSHSAVGERCEAHAKQKGETNWGEGRTKPLSPPPSELRALRPLRSYN